ncbi:MAG: hypothetical protein V7L00_33295 [Nostoc sp.]|uniref:hypothetical protein n=1 Tax=Nostoc sp. TaxID=1180 RepID=UPI002FF715C7
MPKTFFCIFRDSVPNWRCGVILAQEGDRWIVSIAGYLGDRAKEIAGSFRRLAFRHWLSKLTAQ